MTHYAYRAYSLVIWDILFIRKSQCIMHPPFGCIEMKSAVRLLAFFSKKKNQIFWLSFDLILASSLDHFGSRNSMIQVHSFFLFFFKLMFVFAFGEQIELSPQNRKYHLTQILSLWNQHSCSRSCSFGCDWDIQGNQFERTCLWFIKTVQQYVFIS